MAAILKEVHYCLVLESPRLELSYENKKIPTERIQNCVIDDCAGA